MYAGIDMTNCYFSDASHATPYNSVNLLHRKVVYYNTYADAYDYGEAHGTHVCGSVAGNSTLTYGDMVKYNGKTASKATYTHHVQGGSLHGQ
jgi:hypothetical protein